METVTSTVTSEKLFPVKTPVVFWLEKKEEKNWRYKMLLVLEIRQDPMEQSEPPKVKVCQGKLSQVLPSCSWLDYEGQQTVDTFAFNLPCGNDKESFKFFFCPDVRPNVENLKQRPVTVSHPCTSKCSNYAHTLTGHFINYLKLNYLHRQIVLGTCLAPSATFKWLWKWLRVSDRCCYDHALLTSGIRGQNLAVDPKRRLEVE